MLVNAGAVWPLNKSETIQLLPQFVGTVIFDKLWETLSDEEQKICLREILFRVDDRSWGKLQQIHPNLQHDMTTKDYGGRTAFLCACWRMGVSTSLLSDMIALGAQVNATDDEGNTALHFGCRSQSCERIRYLLSLDPSMIKKTNNKGQNALHVAVCVSSSAVVSLLLSVDGSLVHAPDKTGKTPLEKDMELQRKINKGQLGL